MCCAYVYVISKLMNHQTDFHWGFLMKVTNKMQLCRLIYFSLSALHVSGDVFAHHQEHLTILDEFQLIQYTSQQQSG